MQTLTEFHSDIHGRSGGDSSHMSAVGRYPLMKAQRKPGIPFIPKYKSGNGKSVIIPVSDVSPFESGIRGEKGV